jgi:NitT/TauT family transport system ATP-binding protein
MAKLVARDLTKIFPPRRAGAGAVTALDHVNFEVQGGTFVSLVGPSGCGKTTFLNIVSQVETPTAGKVEILGSGSGSERIGYVFQDPRLLPWRTVLDNILYVLDEGTRPERVELARRHLAAVGLAHAADMYPGQLSGGMQQRIGIARAMCIDPGVLLMDEPFSHLDAVTARGLREQVQRLWQATDATVLFVTHDVLEAVLLSNRVLMMRPGGVLHADIPVDLPYPRNQTDPAVATKQAEIIEIFEAMERAAVAA